MIFDRKLLRAAVVRALADSRAEFDRAYTAQIERWNREREDWVADNEETWYQACANIEGKLRKNEPIMAEDLPRDRKYRGDVLVYKRSSPTVSSVTHNGARNTYTPPQHLLDFLTVLDLSSDETVTSNALKELGFGNLKKIVQYVTAEDPTA